MIERFDQVQPIPIVPEKPGIFNGIPYYFGFFVKGVDSIYLLCTDFQLFCINRKCEILKKIDYSGIQNDYSALMPAESISRFTKGAVIRGENVFFLQKDSRQNYTRLPSDYRFLFRYNTKNDSLILSPISLPDDYWKNGKLEMNLFLTYNDTDGKFVFGNKYSDVNYTSRDGSRIDETYYSRSNSIDEYPVINPDIAGQLSPDEYYYLLIRYSYNVGLLWDPYYKIYYRFVWPGIKDIRKDESQLLSQIYNSYPTFTIDILDRDFNLIGSCALPENKYNWNYYFLTRDGLYLAVNSSEPLKTTWTFHQFKVKIQSD